MIFDITPRSARLGGRMRLGLLGVVGLLLGHSAVYATRFGWGRSLDSAMTASGHDGYWTPFTVFAFVAGAVLLLTSMITIATLHRRLESVPISGGLRPGTRSYRSEFASLWPRLFLLVTLAFALQENVESWVSDGAVPGIDVLLGHGFPTTLAVLAAITLGLAAFGALVRWRIHALQARLADALGFHRPIPVAVLIAPEWAEVHAAAAHRWTIDRLDAGRAPPRALPA